MANFQQRQIIGKWREGFALDVHTLSSTPIGYNEFGHLQFDNKRSEMGDLLYNLKYNKDKNSVAEIANAVETLMKTWRPNVDIIVPVPPSTQRTLQPVIMMAEAISQQLKIPMANCVTRTRETPQLKNVFDLDERLKLLSGLHAVDKSAVQGKNILLFDDLYRSGATMNAITTELYENGKAANVFALTITRTRSNQ